MTYSSSGPSLAQAPDVDPALSSSDSSSSSSSYSNSHSHSHSHSNSDSPHARSGSGKRHAHLHRHDYRDVDVDANQDHHQGPSEDQDDSERSIDTVSRLRHSHRRLQYRDAQTAPLKIEIRDDTATGYVTQVVQTVSVVQVVDSVGSPIAVQTLYGDPNTIVIDSASGSTVSASNPDSSTQAAPASNAASTDNVVQSSDDMTPPEATTTPAADATTSNAGSAVYLVPTVSSSDLLSASYSLPLDTQNSAQTPGASIGTGINGALNGTNSTPTAALSSTSSQTTLTGTNLYTTPGASSHSTPDATASDSTTFSVLKNVLSTPSTRSLTSSSISSFTSSATTETTETTDLSSTILSSTVYSYSTETWTSTLYADGGGSGGGDATAASQPADSTTTSSADGSSGGALSTTQKQVLGGVMGSIAGVAVLALLVMLALKYKKRQGNQSLLGNSPPRSNVKGLITGGDSGNGSGGAMAERTGPFAVAAALAGLTGKRNQTPPEPAPSGERGFYRVSGKKLHSVLQTGGDGYSDPRDRDSVASGHTDYWRGSQAFDPSEGGSTRLALGSPMRPVSGVPVIRTGPARTPIKEENPFTDPISRPRPDSDALGDSIGGGSITSQDGSWGSPSRFQERI